MEEKKRLIDKVGPEEWLYRRYYNPLEKNISKLTSQFHSRIFKLRPKDNGELSVDVKSLTTPEKAISDSHKFFLVEIQNKSVLKIENLCTFHDPLRDGTNNAHAVITGMTIDDDVIPGLLARASRLVEM